MKRKRFRLWHSILGMGALVLVEATLLWFLRSSSEPVRSAGVLVFAAIGAVSNIIVATDAIREVRNATHMLVLLSAVITEFVLYFTFQYWYLLAIAPNSFSGLHDDPVSLLLHSTMIFVFNPIYLPTGTTSRILVLINTLGALVLVLFVLQNVWQFRAPEKARQ
jgi:hypothetical protein